MKSETATILGITDQPPAAFFRSASGREHAKHGRLVSEDDPVLLPSLLLEWLALASIPHGVH